MWRFLMARESRRAVALGAATILLPFRCVHERPFLDLPTDVSQGEAYDMARDALVQLNVMVRRGIEPDALMYTSLIATMGRAKLEWQAYKLFSRMLEQGVRPLPETYVALRDATSPSRRRLRQDLQLKIEESLESLPSELAEEELARRQEQDRLCVEKFEDYMRGVLPTPPPCASHTQTTMIPAVQGEGGRNDDGDFQKERNGASAAATKTDGGGQEEPRPVATMHIRNPTDAWSTARMMEEQRGIRTQRTQGSDTIALSDELHRLHEEELRIFLAAQRQLRHGTKDELVRRVLDNVPETSIRDMLGRRKHYFRSVAHILENDIHALRRENIGENKDVLQNSVQEQFSAADRTLTAAEKETVAPEVLHTPWGILRKPMKREPDPSASRSMERLQRISLSLEELQLIRCKGETGDLDELPESLLRRYAFEFNLKWKRRFPLSLLEAVQWHCTTFLPEQLDGKVVVRPTPALRRQQEEEGMHKTLENYEAFRIISQRTNNLQVVDHKEINLHLKKIQKTMLQKERHTEETLRRERNLLDAATLAASAKSFTPPDGTSTTVSRVLGVNEGGDSSIAKIPPPASTSDTRGDSLVQEECHELPPWAIFSGAEEFDISTGRFGDPDVGRYQELSDGRFKVLPSREAQDKWAVDRQLLPGPLQDKLQRAELQQKLRHEAIERRYQQKLQYNRYRKWDSFLRKAQEKGQREKSSEEEEEVDAVRPLPPKRRLSQLLRKGRDKAPVEGSVKAKYTRSL
ncbi:hypothetical protein C3747_53g117 [Trypanosoma cruzi]|uniref:Uncharacterized protein n=2 Tax=Trypanosoma cruzi TaxID=5693 RepID=Q4DDF1_TRYCC|nr:hypothetical protein, conserved [Trypanosoma cruzi]EAN90547.1 hypothetical protein, conserved [Trypanosoma cruzi]PWV12250.1 hypothetical protein C3747_53g117 [Trypanosoma cruzi]RNC58328.1 hypothetical protein TcCL_ESM04053 [Trypanosoma cruzi]|eukprot:XP_812398.1 hypothetical protein [Trypanosoma cruzi strain CL Brener]